MERALTVVMRFLPLAFGLGFLAPLVTAMLTMTGVTPPFGLEPGTLGLLVGGGWGLLASVSGRWL